MKRDESNLQIACVNWFGMQYPKIWNMLIAVPNGGRRDKITAAILKREGVRAGVADLLLLVPSKGYGCLGLEMKTAKGTQSTNQKQWQKDFEQAGNKYVICRNIEEFMTTINDYLK